MERLGICMQIRSLVLVLLLLIVTLHASRCAATAPSRVLFGSASHGAIFDDLNIWLRLTGDGPVQSVRSTQVPFDEPMGTLFADSLASIGNAWSGSGAVPIINWLPYAYANWTYNQPNELIAEGAYDGYIDAFLSALNTTFIHQVVPPRRAYIRFAPSPNGNWFPWAPTCPSCAAKGQTIQQTPQSYVAMFRHVIGKLRAAFPQRDEVQVIFDLSTYTADPTSSYSDFYPGDDLVDWVSLTGNNWGNTINGNSWSWPSDMYAVPLQEIAKMLSNSTAPSKPLALTCAGSVSTPNGPTAKAQWLVELLQLPSSVLPASLGQINMIMYQNEDAGPSDLSIFGGGVGTSQWTSPSGAAVYWTYPTVPEVLGNASAGYTGPSSTNTRLITDAEFCGRNDPASCGSQTNA